MGGGNALPAWAKTWNEGQLLPCSGDHAHGHLLELKLKFQVGEQQRKRENLDVKPRRLDFILQV